MIDLTPEARRALALARAVMPTIQPWQEAIVTHVADHPDQPLVISTTPRDGVRTARTALEFLRHVTQPPRSAP